MPRKTIYDLLPRWSTILLGVTAHALDLALLFPPGFLSLVPLTFALSIVNLVVFELVVSSRGPVAPYFAQRRSAGGAAASAILVTVVLVPLASGLRVGLSLVAK
ncbi:hypothetical protein JCM8547_008937 [Rhodosporidiobolus lusitaniae]